MPRLETKPNPIRRGQRLPGARTMNRIIQPLIREIRGAGDTNVSYYGDRLVIDSNTIVGSSELQIVQYIVLEVFPDMLRCVPYIQKLDGSGAWVPQEYDPNLEQDPVYQRMPEDLAIEGFYTPNDVPAGEVTTPIQEVNWNESVFVVKPYTLQQTPWDGSSVTLNENNVFLEYTGLGKRKVRDSNNPSVYDNEIISPDYFLGDLILAARVTTGYVDFDGAPITWMDINTAGRSWVTKPSTGQYVIREILTDYLKCVEYQQTVDSDGNWIPPEYDVDLQSTDTDFVYIAKPYSLQQTTWENKTVTLNSLAVEFNYTDISKRRVYKHSDHAVFEDQVIVPDYFIGDIIQAGRATTGFKNGEDAITWIDLNSAARAWAVES